MLTAKRTAHAGPCINGSRHKWGKETNRCGDIHIYYEEPCLNCRRVRIRVYTRTGNHVEGYETREPTCK